MLSSLLFSLSVIPGRSSVCVERPLIACSLYDGGRHSLRCWNHLEPSLQRNSYLNRCFGITIGIRQPHEKNVCILGQLWNLRKELFLPGQDADEVREETGVYFSLWWVEKESNIIAFSFVQEGKNNNQNFIFSWEKTCKTKLGSLAAYNHVIFISILL